MENYQKPTCAVLFADADDIITASPADNMKGYDPNLWGDDWMGGNDL